MKARLIALDANCYLVLCVIDKTEFTATINDIFTKQEQNEMRKKIENCKTIHSPWIHLEDTHDKSMCEPNDNDTYTCPEDVPKCMSSNCIQNIIKWCTGSLVPLFILILLMTLLTHIVKKIRKYMYQDWVEQKDRQDFDGNWPRKNSLLQFQIHLMLTNIHMQNHNTNMRQQVKNIPPFHTLCLHDSGSW